MQSSKVRNPSAKTLILLCCIATFLPGCGPSASEMARREAWQSEFSRRQDQLRTHAQQRIAAGESIPEKVQDPGYEIQECVAIIGMPTPKEGVPDNVVSLTPSLGTSFVCGNTKAGQRIVAWRKWYCDGSKHKKTCVLGTWKNGEPTFSGDYLQSDGRYRSGVLVKDSKTGEIKQYIAVHQPFELKE